MTKSQEICSHSAQPKFTKRQSTQCTQHTEGCTTNKERGIPATVHVPSTGSELLYVWDIYPLGFASLGCPRNWMIWTKMRKFIGFHQKSLIVRNSKTPTRNSWNGEASQFFVLGVGENLEVFHFTFLKYKYIIYLGPLSLLICLLGSFPTPMVPHQETPQLPKSGLHILLISQRWGDWLFSSEYSRRGPIMFTFH